MSNTRKHKDKGMFHNGIIKFHEASLAFQNFCHRHNFEWGYFRKQKKLIQEKDNTKLELEEA